MKYSSRNIFFFNQEQKYFYTYIANLFTNNYYTEYRNNSGGCHGCQK